MIKYLITALAIVTLLGQDVYSQTSNRWKRMRYEVFGGVGATNFLGELGGSNGSAGYIKDLEFSMTRPCYTIGGRYMLTENLGWQASISHGWVKGDDKKTTEQYRSARNLNFRSQIVEVGTRLEYALLQTSKGHRYNLRKVKGRAGNRVTLDIFAGVAAFYFNPKGYDEETDKWYKLRPLGTEGQNYAKTRKPYSRISMSFPVGFNAKYMLNRKWSIGLEYGIRPTLTDYIDDVSGTYADPELIAENASESDKELVKRLADPNANKYDENGKYVNMNQQRGDNKRNDMYMFMFITLNHKLRTTRKGLPSFN